MIDRLKIETVSSLSNGDKNVDRKTGRVKVRIFKFCIKKCIQFCIFDEEQQNVEYTVDREIIYWTFYGVEK